MIFWFCSILLKFVTYMVIQSLKICFKKEGDKMKKMLKFWKKMLKFFYKMLKFFNKMLKFLHVVENTYSFKSWCWRSWLLFEVVQYFPTFWNLTVETIWYYTYYEYITPLWYKIYKYWNKCNINIWKWQKMLKTAIQSIAILKSGNVL